MPPASAAVASAAHPPQLTGGASADAIAPHIACIAP